LVSSVDMFFLISVIVDSLPLLTVLF